MNTIQVFIYIHFIAMIINLPYFNGLREESDCYSFWIDYLWISLRDSLNFWWLVNWINTTNSDSIFIDSDLFSKYTITARKNWSTADFDIHVSIDNISYRLLEIVRTDNNSFGTTGFIKIYWTTFRLIELGYISNIYDLLLDLFKEEDYELILNSYLTRVDWRLDLFYYKKHKIPNFNKILLSRMPWVTEYKEMWSAFEWMWWNEIKKLLVWLAQWGKESKTLAKYTKDNEDFSWWTLGSKNNKWHFIRCYNKILDVIKKCKCLLYSDYLEYESVWRIETEFRINELHSEEWTRFCLKDLDQVEVKCKGFYWIEFIKESKKPSKAPDTEYIRAMVPYIVNTQNRLIKLEANWINKFVVAIHTELYKQNKSKAEVWKNLVDAARLLKDDKITEDYFVKLNTVYNSAQVIPKVQ